MEALRQIPPVNDVLRADELAAFRDIVNQPFVTEILDNVLTETRRELAQTRAPASRAELTSMIAGKLRIAYAKRWNLLCGVLLMHPELFCIPTLAALPCRKKPLNTCGKFLQDIQISNSMWNRASAESAMFTLTERSANWSGAKQQSW